MENKNSLSFICFDVCEFYPSITEKLLSKALDFASTYRQITSHERKIILHAKRSLLFSDNYPWEKKSANNQFDVTMGSFDGAETCELVGCYLLSLLTKKYGQNIGLYRDDGLAAFNAKPREIKNIKKGICKVFRDNDLKITVEANTTKVNFLDVTLDLRSEKYYVGLTATEFKTRWLNHQMSFKHEEKRNDTELSKYLWQLKEKKKDFSIEWKILAKARAYTNLTKPCNLCITEKFFIISKPKMATLNKRNELVSTCRHRRKYVLRYN